MIRDRIETATAGRPRDENSKRAILQAAFALLETKGYSGLAMEAVAKQAGVGKTTIYRWWNSRAELAVDAFFDQTVAELEFPDTGSAREDFRLQIHQLAKLLRSKRGLVLAALLVGSLTDKELALAVDRNWVEPRKRWGNARMKRAVAAGECVEGLIIFQALDTLYSPLYAHLLLGAGAHSELQTEAHCQFVFPLIFRQ